MAHVGVSTGNAAGSQNAVSERHTNPLSTGQVLLQSISDSFRVAPVPRTVASNDLVGVDEMALAPYSVNTVLVHGIHRQEHASSETKRKDWFREVCIDPESKGTHVKDIALVIAFGLDEKTTWHFSCNRHQCTYDPKSDGTPQVMLVKSLQMYPLYYSAQTEDAPNTEETQFGCSYNFRARILHADGEVTVKRRGGVLADTLECGEKMHAHVKAQLDACRRIWLSQQKSKAAQQSKRNETASDPIEADDKSHREDESRDPVMYIGGRKLVKGTCFDPDMLHKYYLVVDYTRSCRPCVPKDPCKDAPTRQNTVGHSEKKAEVTVAEESLAQLLRTLLEHKQANSAPAAHVTAEKNSDCVQLTDRLTQLQTQLDRLLSSSTPATAAMR